MIKNSFVIWTMSLIIILAALLPAIMLWLYLWKKDIQKEPTSWLVKAEIVSGDR